MSTICQTTGCGAKGITTERVIRVFAGFMVLLSLALGVAQSPLFVSGHFLWLTAFVGLNLFQSGFTRFCPLDSMLRRGLNIPTEAERGAAS